MAPAKSRHEALIIVISVAVVAGMAIAILLLLLWREHSAAIAEGAGLNACRGCLPAIHAGPHRPRHGRHGAVDDDYWRGRGGWKWFALCWRRHVRDVGDVEGLAETTSRSEALNRGLLLGHAVQGPQSQDKVSAVDAHDRAAGEYVG